MQQLLSQNDPLNIEKATTQVALAILLCVFCSSWIVFFFLIMPKGWLGGMDGYFYASMIKTYMNQFALAGIDPTSPMNYPQYFFFFIGTSARILGIEDLDVATWISHIVAYLAYPAFGYLLFRAFLSSYQALFIILLSYVLYFFSWGYDHLWEKPHEIISLLATPALFVYVAHNSGKEISKIKRIFAGLIYAFSFGSYTPFAIVPTAAFVCVLAVDAVRKIIIKKPLNWKSYIDFPFLIPAFILVLPYILTIVITYMTYDQGMGHVPAAFLHNLNYEFLTAGTYSLTYYLTIFLTFAGFARLLFVREYSPIILYSILLVVIGVALFAAVVTAYQYGMKHTSPFKYVIHIPFIGAILLTLLFSSSAKSVFHKISQMYDGKIVLFLVASLAFVVSNSFIIHLYQTTHYKFSYSLFEKRTANTKDLVAAITALKKDHRLEYYLGNYESMFLNSMVPGKFVSYIMFNESYASVYENVQERAKKIQSATEDESGVALYNLLKDEGVDILILVGAKDGVYEIKHSITVGEEIQRPNIITISQKLLSRMVKDNMLQQKMVGDFNLYLVKAN